MPCCSVLRPSVTVLLAVMLTACGQSATGQRKALDFKDPTPVAKCRVAASQSSPLVTEWPASEKAHLESQMTTGAVVVSYSGCELRVLPECRLAGRYEWQRTSLSEDLVEIRNEDDLYAKLPLGAATLEGELKSRGRLSVRTTVAGQLRLAAPSMSLAAECGDATHVVAGMSVGAFRLVSGEASSGSAAAALPLARVGGGVSASESVVRQSGAPSSCAEASDHAPSPECRSPLQLFLLPLPNRDGGGTTRDGAGVAPSSAAVHVSFQAEGSGRWRFMEGSRPVCDLPCSRWLEPQPSVLTPWHLHRDGASASDTLDIPVRANLGGYSPGTRVVAVPRERNDRAVPGWTLTLIGGALVYAGGAAYFQAGKASAGDPEAERQQKTLGMWLGGAGVIAIGIGAYLLLTARVSNEVEFGLAPEAGKP